MIFVEDKSVKIGRAVLPGLVKSIEITRDAAIDEVDVEGAPVKPKQAVGYEEAAVRIDLIVGATSGQTAESQIEKINALFRAKGQDIPQPMDIVCSETMLAGINRVMFHKLTYKKDNKSDLYTVSLQFCEYAPLPIKITTAAASAGTTSSGTQSTAASAAQLSSEYQGYLDGSRGTAPRIADKTAKTPAVDNRSPGGRAVE